MTENELILTSILDCDRIDLIADPKELTPDQQSRYDQMQVRRKQGEPLQYIIGQTNFMGIDLSVDKNVLIPRPETEILVELAIEKANTMQVKDVLHILDLGSGSGNISIAIAKNIPNAEITALDSSEGALKLAMKNAKANGVAGRIRFFHKDMAAYLKVVADKEVKFDMIISNPPYIPTGQLAKLPVDVQREPRSALDGCDDGLHFYREIIEYGYQALAPDGFLFMEIGDGQRVSIEKIFASHSPYRQVKFYKDYVGTDRVVMARLDETL